MPREVRRVEAALLPGPQQQIDVRALERLFDLARQRIRRVAAQLTQDDRRGRFEVVERSELEVEQHRDRNGDDHGQTGGKTHAAVVQQMAERARLRRAGGALDTARDRLARTTCALLRIHVVLRDIRDPTTVTCTSRARAVSQSLTCFHPGSSGRCVSSAHAMAFVSASSCCRYSRGKAAAWRAAAHQAPRGRRPSPADKSPAGSPAPDCARGPASGPRRRPTSAA